VAHKKNVGQNMHRPWLTDLTFYLVAPFVVVAILGSVWLAGSATMENYRLGVAYSESIRVVEVARELRVVKGVSAERAADELLKRLSERNIVQPQQAGASFLGQAGSRAYSNPWGKPVNVVFYPDTKTFRLAMEVSAAACHRLLGLYAKAIEPLGVRRIDVRAQSLGSIWRLVYEEGQGGAGSGKKGGSAISSQIIDASCGNGEETELSLMFFL
jgi:hypothetical protein